MRVLRSSPRDYASHMGILRRDYPVSNAEAHGMSLEDARKASAQEFRHLLPKGQQTPGQHFYALYTGERKVGYLWLMEAPNKTLFISDIYVFSQYRSKGLGAKAMKWVEGKARKLGSKRVRLHVFGSNHRAVAFYERCGFVPANIMMNKPVAEQDPVGRPGA